MNHCLHGPPPLPPPPPPPPPPPAPAWDYRRRGPKVRKGDVRAAALLVLADGPHNGYQIIQEIAERSGDVWKPSPGSVYPALAQLEDEGLVRITHISGRRTFELTENGRDYLREHRAELAEPWITVTAGMTEGMTDLREALRHVGGAVDQVMQIGSDEQIATARELLQSTRRGLYRILAGDDDDQS